jgi:hypothetical protein
VAEDGRITTIFSDNKNLVRLVKKRAITMCNHQVHPTNFDNLFLVANPEHLPKALLRPVPDHAVSLTTYFNQQSNWLRGYFDETVTEYMGRLIQQRCKAEQEKRALEWAELAGKQAAITAGETISLGDGMFSTATGEAWRYYRCRAVRVIGVNRNKCYNALPVIASAGDTERFLRSSDLPAETPLYMEPNTRMLTALAVEFPCSPHLAPLYQNDRKTWIQATPSLLPAAEPRPLDTVDLVTFDLIGKGQATGPDFEEGGIYPIDALKRMEDVRSQHKKAAIGTNELAKVVGQFYHPSFPAQRQGSWVLAPRHWPGRPRTPDAAEDGHGVVLDHIRPLRQYHTVPRRDIYPVPDSRVRLEGSYGMRLPRPRPPKGSREVLRRHHAGHTAMPR